MRFVFLIFLLSIFADSSSAQVLDFDTSNPTNVDYCELIQNPNLYSNKLIRLQGIYRREFEVSTFYNKQCQEDKFPTTTWATIYPKSLECSDKKTKAVFETFKSGKGGSDLETTLIGKFDGSEKHGGFGHLNQYKFQFTVSCVEKAKLTPTEKFGCERVDDTKPFHYISYVKTEKGFAPDYENVSSIEKSIKFGESKSLNNKTKPKKEKLVWLKLVNNTNCPIIIPTVSNYKSKLQNGEITQEIQNGTVILPIYDLSSRYTNRKSRLISKKTIIKSVLNSGREMYFAVPLKYFGKDHYDIRIDFDKSNIQPELFQHHSDRFYQPFYFSALGLPEKLREK